MNFRKDDICYLTGTMHISAVSSTLYQGRLSLEWGLAREAGPHKKYGFEGLALRVEVS
jgi:hypothetical protein